MQVVSRKMFAALFLCGFAFAGAHLQELAVQVYVPPSQDVIVNKYFQTESRNETSDRVGKVIGENLYKTINSVNLTQAKDDVVDKSGNASKTVSDVVWTGFLRNLLRNSYETTTYKYPTAVWTAEQHERLKENRRNQLKRMPKIFLMRPSPSPKPVVVTEEERPAKPTTKPKRGKVKWKSSRGKNDGQHLYRTLRSKEDVDKFLEQSLFKYLVSSNLIENIGNVSVETFSEILRNITRQKADKRQFWPYDENKDLRIKFRDEVFVKRKNESPSRRKFLEKQFQKRLERMKDYFNRKNKDNQWRNQNSVQVPTQKPEELTLTTENVRTTTPVELPVLNETEPTTLQPQFNATEAVIEPEYNITTEANTMKPDFEELKLSVAETVYYKKKPYSLRMFPYEEEETGVIPGIPEVDYPMYSSPPSTGFKCPKEIGQQPRMMADTRTRCQVFYVCTGDGPAAAMLCPNGTMFNENVRVCDWWYNVDC